MHDTHVIVGFIALLLIIKIVLLIIVNEIFN